MTRKAKWCLVLIVLLAGVSILTASDRNARIRAPRRAAPVAQEVDPYEGRTVFVEAFVVQVDLAALYGMEVNPLGQTPHSVSVANLLEYLQNGDKANVLAGAKTVAIHKTGEGVTKKTETRYHAKKRLVNTPAGKKEAVDHVAYDNGETLSVRAVILSEDTIALGYSFSYSGPKEARQQSDVPFDTVRWSWDGDSSLNVGAPRIVGATQDAKTAIFFVLTAHILD